MIENINLGDKLKQLRIQNGYTRQQVSEIINISTSQIGFYETEVRYPSLAILVKLCTLYKVSSDYLLNINHTEQKTLSLDGLTDKQIKALTDTANCFRNPQ